MGTLLDNEAARHLRAAVGLIDETDSPIWRSDIRLRVARSLDPSLRNEAVSLAREALDLAERKGAVALADLARETLARLGT